MCTSFTFHTKDFYFGRNMDLNYHFDEHIVIAPRNYVFHFKKVEYQASHYAFIGMAMVTGRVPLYADGVNEKGLCIAGLNFPNYAHYFEYCPNIKYNIAAYELIPWLLGQCATVEEVKELLRETQIVNIAFKDDLPLPTLHWHIADRSQSIVVESMADGLKIHPNLIGILTNNPPFDFHMTHLSSYLNLVTTPAQNCFTKYLDLKEYSLGMGSMGLPGDSSSPSRFVRLSFLKLHSICQTNEISSVHQVFHLLYNVAVTNGAIFINEDEEYKTIYSICINASKGIYYYTTYENMQIIAIDLFAVNLDSEILIEYPLLETKIIYQQK